MSVTTGIFIYLAVAITIVVIYANVSANRVLRRSIANAAAASLVWAFYLGCVVIFVGVCFWALHQIF